MNNPSLSFNPVIVRAKSGDIVAVDLILNNDGSPVASIDAFISFDENILSLTNLNNPEIKKTDLFASVGAKRSEPGLLYVYAINTNNAVEKSGSVATLYFQAQKTGTTELKIRCTTSNESSKVIKKDPEFPNIIECQKTNSQTSSISVVSGDNVLGTKDRVTPLPIWALVMILMVGVVLFIAIIYKYKKVIYKIKEK